MWFIRRIMEVSCTDKNTNRAYMNSRNGKHGEMSNKKRKIKTAVISFGQPQRKARSILYAP